MYINMTFKRWFFHTN